MHTQSKHNAHTMLTWMCTLHLRSQLLHDNANTVAVVVQPQTSHTCAHALYQLLYCSAKCKMQVRCICHCNINVDIQRANLQIAKRGPSLGEHSWQCSLASCIVKYTISILYSIQHYAWHNVKSSHSIFTTSPFAYHIISHIAVKVSHL